MKWSEAAELSQIPSPSLFRQNGARPMSMVISWQDSVSPGFLPGSVSILKVAAGGPEGGTAPVLQSPSSQKESSMSTGPEEDVQ